MYVGCNDGEESIAEALNVNVYGNGTEGIVLANGFGLVQTSWHYIIPYLACYFKVVVFDMVSSPNVKPQLYDEKKYSNFDGYAKDLVCLLDHLNLTETVYLGHSMSAMIGCVAATNRPELFHHLIFLEGSPRYLNAERYYGGFDMPKVDGILKQIDENFTGWVTQFAQMAVGMNDTDAIAEFEHSLGRMKPEIARSVLKMVLLSDLRQVLPKVKTPSTIILTRNDSVVPKPIAYFMESKLGGHAEVKILESEGHLPQLTAYSQLLEALSGALHLKDESHVQCLKDLIHFQY